MRLGLFGIFCFAGCGGSLACWPGAGGATMDGWLAPYIRVFGQHISYLGILARGILALGVLMLGIRIQLTAGGWGWRGLAGGCCCEVIV